MGSLLLSSESWCMQSFIFSLQDWSLCFPQSCGSIIIKSSWPSRSNSLGIPSPFVRFPGWEAWHRVQNLHNSGRSYLVLFFSSLWLPTWQEWDLIFNHEYAPPIVLMGFLLRLWMWEYLFLVGSSILSMVVQQLVVILVLLQEEVSAYLSTLSSWTRNYSFNFYCCIFFSLQ